jgi:hypothetical protein
MAAPPESSTLENFCASYVDSGGSHCNRIPLIRSHQSSQIALWHDRGFAGTRLHERNTLLGEIFPDSVCPIVLSRK